MIFKQKFLICYFFSYTELRHFMFFFGPKFSVFYNVYSKYEYTRLMGDWCDVVEEKQLGHMQESRAQLNYTFLNKEYESVKKRALISNLINSRLALEDHFHDRTHTMLKTI